MKKLTPTYEELLKREKQLNQCFDNSPSILILLNQDAQIIKINNAGKQFIGVESDDCINKQFANALKCSHSTLSGCGQVKECEGCVLKNNIKNTMLTRSSNELLETNLTTHIGNSKKVHHLQFSTTPIEVDQEVQVLLTINDVSSLKEIQEGLRVAKEKSENNENKFRSLFETLPTGITLADPQGQIIESNPAAELILGLSKEEQQQRAIDGIEWSIIRPDGSIMPVEEYASVRALKENKLITGVEMGVVKGVDNIAWIHVNAVPVTNQGVLISYEDITIKKQAEFELIKTKEKAEESAHKLNLIADNFVKGMLYQVALLDDYKRRFNYVSKVAEELYGVTIDEIKQNPDLIYSKVHPEDVADLIAKEQKALKTMSIFETEARMINTDGSIRWSYFISKPRIINGVMCFDGIELDITKRKQLEFELIKAKEKAEKSETNLKISEQNLKNLNTTKNKLFSILSHDLKSPFNSLLGFNQILIEEINTTNNLEKVEEYANILNIKTKEAYELLLNLLDWSRNQLGGIKINPVNINLSIFFNDLGNNLLKINKNKNIDLIINVDPDINLLIDKNMFEIIFRNLISNAFKFTHNSGKIEISVSRNILETKLSVKDNGVGIKPENLKKLFQLNENISTYGTNNEKGTGLGLILCNEFVQKLNGKIWVESQVGKGSVFNVSFPQN